MPCISCDGDDFDSTIRIVLEEEPEHEFQYPCPFRGSRDCPAVKRALERMLTAAGIGRRYHRVNPEMLQVRALLDAYLQDGLKTGASLIISGPPGVGKTFSLSHIYQKIWWSKACSVKYIFSPTLFKRFADKEDVRVYERCDLLLLDDFGREYRPDWLFSRFEEFVEARYSQMRPTVVTTNLTVDQLKDDGLSRIVDRWRQGGQVIVIAGDSLR